MPVPVQEFRGETTTHLPWKATLLDQWMVDKPIPGMIQGGKQWTPWPWIWVPVRHKVKVTVSRTITSRIHEEDNTRIHRVMVVLGKVSCKISL